MDAFINFRHTIRRLTIIGFLWIILKMHGTAVNVAENELNHEFEATVAASGGYFKLRSIVGSSGFYEQSQHEPLI